MRHLTFSIAALFATLLCAQNAAPTVTITQVVVDVGANLVTIAYDLQDAENDPCTVALRASANGGAAYTIDTQNSTGDVGQGVEPGAGRTITWTYSGVPNIFEVTVSVVADDGHAPSVQDMVDQVSANTVGAWLEAVAIPRHHSAAPAGIAAIRDTLHHTFNALDLQVTLQDVTFGGATVPNVIGRQQGMLDDARTIIVDGHYDAVTNTPGADDNATGVVATLEAARILSQYRFRKSLRYIGFSYEEQGLIGSGFYVQNGIPAWETIEGVLNAEMIGYYSDAPNSQSLPSGFNLLFPAAVAELEANEYRGDFLTVVGNTASTSLIDAFLAACDDHVPDLKRIPLAVLGNGLIAPDLRRSDHARFWDAGIKALMLTDGSEFRNSNYHTPNDAIATIDIPFLTNCVKAIVAAAARLAEPVNAGSDVFDLAQLVGMEEHLHHFPCLAGIHPNPTSGQVRLRLEAGCDQRITAELFDLRGEKMGGRDLRPAGTANEWTFDVGHLAAGTYLLVLRAGESSHTLRVEVAR